MAQSSGSTQYVKPELPAVTVHGRKCDFGECIRELLLNGVANRPHKLADLHVKTEWKYPWLNLTLSDSSRGTVFQHAPYCPALEHASPQPSGFVKVGIATVLERDGKVLLSKRHAQLRSFPNLWVVPGGHIEPDETMAQTAVREIYEETGLKNNIHCFDELLGVWESCYPHRAELGKMTHHHAVCYAHAIATGPLEELHLQSSEVQSIAWLTRDQVAAVVNMDGSVEIDIFHAEEPGTFVHADTKLGDSWHGERALVSKVPEKVTALDVVGNMTAGTRFALTLWLEKSKSSML